MKRKVKHKVISVLIAVILIVIIIIAAFGARIKESLANGEEINARWFLGLIYPEKYAYSTEQADLYEYFQLFSQDEVAIVLGNERLEDKGIMINGRVYFKLETAEALFTDRFYYNADEQVLLYTTATSIYEVDLAAGQSAYTYAGTTTPLEYLPAKVVGEQLYVALDYVKMFDNFEYSYYSEPNRVQVFTSWQPYNEAEIVKDTSVRYQGGIKSDILCKVKAGDKVEVLEVLENWTKVRTADGFFGYVENSKLSDPYQTSRTPVTGAYDPVADYTANQLPGKVRMVWHQIYFADDGSDLNSMLSASDGINVVCPTWFYLSDSNGGFANYSSSAYVTNAHNNGYQVWAMVSDVENGGSYDFSEYEMFSSSEKRAVLISNLISAVVTAGADGINVDCEKISRDCGPHFIQFLRELAIETRRNGLVLSVDNYPQNQGNLYYDLREQGIICDYVVLMAYDEHWAGSDAGSIASINFVETSISDALNAGVPASKLINGVPFYTRIWKTEGSSVTSSAVGMDYCQEWMSTRGITPEWSDEFCQYYVNFVDGTATYQIWVEDADSITAKFNIMTSYGIAGVAGWKLGLESDDILPLIYQYFQ